MLRLRKGLKINQETKQRCRKSGVLRFKVVGMGHRQNGLKLGGFLENIHKQYAKKFYIKIHNNEYKNKIINLLQEVDW